jgi:tol-pal system protein YbgF
MAASRFSSILVLVLCVLAESVLTGCVIDRTQQSASYLLRAELDGTRDRARALEKDLLRERQRIDAMQHKASDARKRIAESGATLESFLEELMQVRGELSGLAHGSDESGRFQEDLDMRLSDIEARFAALETLLRTSDVLPEAAVGEQEGEPEGPRGEAAPDGSEPGRGQSAGGEPAMPAPVGPSRGDVIDPAPEEIVVQTEGPTADEVMFQRGLVLIKQRRWDKAGGILQAFIKQHPDSRWHVQAMYLLAECLFNLERYNSAIRQYQKVVDRDETGEWAARAMLKQGLAFSEMGTQEEARVFLSDVIRLYPDSPEAEKARKKQEQLSNE